MQNAAEQSANLLEKANTEVLKEAGCSIQATEAVSFLRRLGTMPAARGWQQDQEIPEKALEVAEAQAKAEEDT